jgi:hypothetical protein
MQALDPSISLTETKLSVAMKGPLALVLTGLVELLDRELPECALFFGRQCPALDGRRQSHVGQPHPRAGGAATARIGARASRGVMMA